MFLWMVGLEVIKQVCCVSRVRKEAIANPKKNHLFLISNSTVFHRQENQSTSTLRFAKSVLSLTEEGEDCSVAFFTAWCLVHVHMSCGGSVGWGLSINTVYMLIRESVDSLCRDGADVQYMQHLSKSHITSQQIH